MRIPGIDPVRWGRLSVVRPKTNRRLLTSRPVFLIFLCLLLLLGVCGPSPAADTTGNLVVRATPGNFSICVRASYLGDDNGNNSLLVEWGLNGVDFSFGSQALSHASFYRYTIGDLTSGTSYQVRVTSQDADNGDLVEVLTDIIPQNSSLLHNSLTTGSDKWSPEGWGIPGGRYGTFDCATCHGRGEANIKQVRTTLTAPNGIDQFPIEQGGGSVVFADIREGSGDGGDDAGGHAVSNRICEACHSITDFHRYDTTVDPDDAGPLTAQTVLDHYNRSDCLRCHPHRNGFAHGGAGGGCDGCHGKDADNGGAGTTLSHSTHTESDADDQRGPALACDACHDVDDFPYFKSGADGNGDGRYSLTETDVCDSCHSPDGSYDGVNNPDYGAKNNWTNGVYSGATLAAGKEKWCASCHDEVPSVIDGIAAPNVIGDETGGYGYGTGWGYYKTGHGLAAGIYPASQGAAAAVECGGCHDFVAAHVDGDARTYSFAGDNYQSGYRLKLGMDIPRIDKDADANPQASDFTLCFSCHVTSPFLVSTDHSSNFRKDTWSADEIPVLTQSNEHYRHLGSPPTGQFSTGSWWDSDWDGTAESFISCVACHNVHGSPSPRMVRHGELISTPGTTDKVPAVNFRYTPFTPLAYPTLADSDGGKLDDPGPWGGGTVENSGICKMCHGNAASYLRAPTDVAPSIQGVYGAVGGNSLTVVFSEGVYTTTGASGALISADFTFNDLDDGRGIVGVSHVAGAANAVLTLSSVLDGSNDVGVDTLAAATSTSIYDAGDAAMGTDPVTVTTDADPPVLSDPSPAAAAVDVATDSDISFTLSDAASGIDWSTVSVELSGSRGYAQSYASADTTILTASGTPTSLLVTVAPDADFSHDETITARVNVNDLVGNAMPEASWSFSTLGGGGPFTRVLHPSDVADNSGTFTAVGGDWADILDYNDGDNSHVERCCGPAGPVFYVDMDNPVGLDGASIQSIRFHIYARYTAGAGDTTPIADQVNIGYRTGTATVWSGNQTTDAGGVYNLISSLVYTADSDGGALDLNDIDNLQIAVQRNNAGTAPKLLVTEVYVEITYGVAEGDTTAPTIADISPADNDTGVLIDSNLTFTLADSGGGVDWSTFSIQLSGDQGYARTFTDVSAEVSTTGNASSYGVTVNPDALFSGEEVITATVNVNDLAGNPLPETVWSFTTAAASNPLTLILTPAGKNASSAAGWNTNGDWTTALDENDGDTGYGYICCTASNSKLYMDMDDPVGLDTATIQSITFHAYARGVVGTGPNPENGAAVPIDIGYKTGTNTVWRGSFTTTHTGTDKAYDLVSSITYTTDSDGGALDLSDINNLQLIVNWTTGRLRVTQFYVEITYVP